MKDARDTIEEREREREREYGSIVADRARSCFRFFFIALSDQHQQFLKVDSCECFITGKLSISARDTAYPCRR